MLHSEKAISLSKYRLEQALENLNSARKNLEIDELKTANNRAYYCVFHAMRDVIASRQETHEQVGNAQTFFEMVKSYLKQNL